MSGAQEGEPGRMERGRMRRRLRQRRRLRDEKLLDLGALVFELYRQDKRAPELLQRKAAELDEIDAEVRALEDVLEGEGLPAASEAGATANGPEAGAAPSEADAGPGAAEAPAPGVAGGEQPPDGDEAGRA